MNTEDKKFEWDDAKLKELFVFRKKYAKGFPIEQIIEDFKKSKQPYKGVGFEILSFRDYKNENEFYTKDMNGNFTNGLFSKRYDITFLLGHNYPIHSVRRIEDNK